MDINAEISDMRVALASLEAKAKAQEPWYLNIPVEGVECYVSDDEGMPSPWASSGLMRVVEYNSLARLPFRSDSHLRWKYATPVNKGK